MLELQAELQSKLRPEQLETLAKYQGALPEREFQALAAWITTFYPFQLDWMLEQSCYAACVKSRQIGMSHTTAGDADLWGIFHGELTTVISVGELESAEVLDKCKKHATVLQRLGSQWAKVTKSSATEIRFASGGRVLALPSTGGRSFTGNVFLDEYAYQQHDDSVWDAALAVTMHGGRARVASTPNGVGNRFHQLITDPKANVGWALHEIPLKLALSQGMPVDVKKCWAMAMGDPRLFAQMFECSFLDGILQYIPTEAVSAASQQNLYVLPNSGEWYAGLDIGRSNDLTSIAIVHFDGAMATLRALRSVKRTDGPALHGLVEYAFSNYPIRRLCVDATGIGAFPSEEMQRRYGRHRVEPVTFGESSKEELATTLYSAFVDQWIRIPLTDAVIPDIDPDGAKELRNDICSIKRIILPGGGIRYDAPRTAAGHADRAWALALALYGITNRPAGKSVKYGGISES